ncbi:MAG: hypothetical protein NW237_01525 [Cyanobacteriota bacterium]|nr:hypothetical protein [Cyanobacteriota bacterium]
MNKVYVAYLTRTLHQCHSTFCAVALGASEDLSRLLEKLQNRDVAVSIYSYDKVPVESVEPVRVSSTNFSLNNETCVGHYLFPQFQKLETSLSACHSGIPRLA